MQTWGNSWAEYGGDEAFDAWDITLACTTVDDITGAEFDIHIAEDATALVDEDNSYTAIDSEAVQFYGFTPDITQELAFDANPWYQYNLNGGHLLWSQYGVYLIKTSDATFKMQITSYYDDAGTSGNYSFRFDLWITWRTLCVVLGRQGQ